MKTTQLVLPLEYDWIPNFYDKYTLSLPNNKRFHMTPRIAKPYSHYLNAGLSTVSVNAGGGDVPGIAPNKRSTFINQGIVQDAGGGKTWPDYNTQDAINAADAQFSVSGGGYHTITSGAQEGRGGFPDGDPYSVLYDLNPNAYKQFDKRLNERCEALGGAHFGNYDGSMYPDFSNVGAFRTALSSPANALAYMKAHEYSLNPFFNAELWRYRHLLFNQYYRASTDLHVRYAELAGVVTLGRLALQAVNSNRRIMVFVFQLTERPGLPFYTERYVRQLSNGGQAIGHTFPNYAPSHHIDQAWVAMTLGDDLFTWQDQILYGTNPNVLVPTWYLAPNYPYEGQQGGSPLPTANDPDHVYNASRTYPYPPVWEGQTDFAPAGCKMYEIAMAFAGVGGTLSWAAHRTPGGSYCSTGTGYLADRLEDGKPYVQLYENGSKGWVKIVGNNLPATGPTEVEVKLSDGSTVVFLADPGANNLYTFNKNAS